MITIEIHGLDELVRKINDPALLGEPLRNFMSKSLSQIGGQIAQRTPVDTARLRSSFLTADAKAIDVSPIPKWGQLKSNVEYGLFAEVDTRPHWTSIRNLIPWAHRHGINPFALQRKIARKGTKGKHMREQGVEASIPLISQNLNECAREIEQRWDNK